MLVHAVQAVRESVRGVRRRKAKPDQVEQPSLHSIAFLKVRHTLADFFYNTSTVAA